MIGELTTHLWQSTVFAFVAALLTIAFRKNRAKVRYWLWLSASLKFFVPFSFLIRLGSRLGWAPAAQRIAIPDVSLVMERITQPFPEPLSFVVPSPASTNWTLLAIVAVWTLGFAAIALIRLRLWLRVRAAVRASTLVQIPAPVEIRSAPGLLEPGVVGLLHPILLLPEGIMERLTPSQLEAVLAHELCHVRRRDNLFAAVHMIVEAVFWFHPLVWWIGARLVEERERACDEGVLSLGNEPRTYADAILNVCKLYIESPLECVSGVTGSDLKRRIEAIMNNRIGQSLNRARKLLLAGAGVAALAGPVAIGVLIGVGNMPAIHAQSAAVPDREQPPQPDLASPDPQDTPAATRAAIATETAVKYRERRLVAMLLDLDTMTSDEQSRARQSAIDFVHRMAPTDLVAVLSASNGRVSVSADFTNDRAALESDIRKLSGTGSEPTAGARLSRLETAARLLGALPQKKLLMYYSSGMERAAADDPSGKQNAIHAALQSNVAFYNIDASGTASYLTAQAGHEAPAGVAEDEHTRRVAYAQANFGSASSGKGRTYVQYGPPDQIDDSNSGKPVWHYNYLENFHSSVEFEFTAENRATQIKWPPPVATFFGVPGAATQTENMVNSKTIAGLPGRHISLATYPAGEVQTLTVPLDSMSGRIDISGQVKMLPNPSSIGMGAGFGAAFVRDNVQASHETYQTNFTLEAGSYVCTVLVKDGSTGQSYVETINFEVR